MLLEVDGQIWSLPRKWTNLVPPSPIEVIGKGEVLFSVEDLIELLTLMESLIDKEHQNNRNKCKGKYAACVKTKTPHS